jgi:uncharacterized membrane protein (UPF0127 family)
MHSAGSTPLDGMRHVGGRAARAIPGKWWRLACCALLGTLLSFHVSSAGSRDAGITLTVLDQRLDVEVAASQADRVRGLSRRWTLPGNRGMLFVFRDPALHVIWMRDTHVPLSVAFLDEQGVIINIEDMEPDTLDRHTAARPAKYALEVNRGWFDRHGIRPGMRVEGIGQAPPGDW